MKSHSAAKSAKQQIWFFARNSTQEVDLVMGRAVDIAPEIQIIEEQEEKTELEPLYRVLIHNDHFTPMDFVVQILKTIFYQSNPKAFEIMLIAHVTGLAYVQT